MNRLAYILLASALSVTDARALAFQVDSVDVQLAQVADSGSYHVYSYIITNPTTSTWAISVAKLDIGSASGTPANLPATGELLDATAVAAGDPHAEVGPISPGGWKAGLTRTAELWWYPPSTAVSTADSIAPGATKGGFGIRSSYLPGINPVTAEPTVESCCLSPVSGADGVWYPSPGDYSAIGDAVIPRYQPSEVTLDLLQSQLTAVCTDPLWIDDTTLCSRLTDSLDATESRVASSDNAGARSALDGVLTVLNAEREPSGSIENNAYWLLSLNTQQLLENLPASLPIWEAGVSYVVGDEVSHLGLDYRCRQSHTSQVGWEPPNVYALWERINTGGAWAPQVMYQTDAEAIYQGTTYRAIQGHQAQVGWEPPNQPALWEEVN